MASVRVRISLLVAKTLVRGGSWTWFTGAAYWMVEKLARGCRGELVHTTGLWVVGELAGGCRLVELVHAGCWDEHYQAPPHGPTGASTRISKGNSSLLFGFKVASQYLLLTEPMTQTAGKGELSAGPAPISPDREKKGKFKAQR